MLGASATREELEAAREQLGLNDPLWDQYVRHLGEVLTLDGGQRFMCLPRDVQFLDL